MSVCPFGWSETVYYKSLFECHSCRRSSPDDIYELRIDYDKDAGEILRYVQDELV
jgi:hypothetical protein